MLDDKISEFLTTNKHGRRKVSCKLAVHQVACTTTVLTRFDAAAFPMRPLFKAACIRERYLFQNHMIS